MALLTCDDTIPTFLTRRARLWWMSLRGRWRRPPLASLGRCDGSCIHSSDVADDDRLYRLCYCVVSVWVCLALKHVGARPSKDEIIHVSDRSASFSSCWLFRAQIPFELWEPHELRIFFPGWAMRATWDTCVCLGWATGRSLSSACSPWVNYRM